jgi:hypothetical protein
MCLLSVCLSVGLCFVCEGVRDDTYRGKKLRPHMSRSKPWSYSQRCPGLYIFIDRNSLGMPPITCHMWSCKIFWAAGTPTVTRPHAVQFVSRSHADFSKLGWLVWHNHNKKDFALLHCWCWELNPESPVLRGRGITNRDHSMSHPPFLSAICSVYDTV